MYAEDKLLPISGLQHIVYCPRQCALIHVEQAWAENDLTTSGQLLHRKTNGGIDETRDGNRIVRCMDLVSLRLGLIGKSDIVEFAPPPGVSPNDAKTIASQGSGGQNWEGWTITPIEYKRGRQKNIRIWGDCDRVQLCAQALCIEEMLGICLKIGQIFYGMERRRIEIPIDHVLRQKTEAFVEQMHVLLNGEKLPLPVNDRRCKRCSLREICMPEEVQRRTNASRWLANQVTMHLDE